MSNVSIAGYASWPAYDTFLIVSLSGRPVYDPNPLRFNPNPKKSVSGSCRVHGLGRTLTPLLTTLYLNFILTLSLYLPLFCLFLFSLSYYKIFIFSSILCIVSSHRWHPILQPAFNFTKRVKGQFPLGNMHLDSSH